jgi:hypothetical protein
MKNGAEFRSCDQTDTAEGVDNFLRGQEKKDQIEAHILALGDPDISQDSCNAHCSAIGCLIRGLPQAKQKEISFRVFSTMWIAGEASSEIPPKARKLFDALMDDS